MNKFITTPEALKIIRQIIGRDIITLPTLIAWIKKYNLGRKIGSRWFINETTFIKYLETNEKEK